MVWDWERKSGNLGQTKVETNKAQGKLPKWIVGDQ
jgi:hypothetical protein